MAVTRTAAADPEQHEDERGPGADTHAGASCVGNRDRAHPMTLRDGAASWTTGREHVREADGDIGDDTPITAPGRERLLLVVLGELAERDGVTLGAAVSGEHRRVRGGRARARVARGSHDRREASAVVAGTGE